MTDKLPARVRPISTAQWSPTLERKVAALCPAPTYTCCRAERAEIKNSRWKPDAVGRGIAVKTDAVGAHAAYGTDEWCRQMRAWGICTRRAGKLYMPRSRLYRSRFVQLNIRCKALAKKRIALAEIYTMLCILQLSFLR